MEYKQIPQYTAYEVSRCGVSVRRISNKKEVKQAFQLIKGKSSGYLYCTMLWDATDQAYIFPTKRIAVHRLVALAWLAPPQDGQIWVNHIDGNKANNNAENLEWTTISQNIIHAHKTGLKVPKKGTEHWRYGKKTSNEAKAKMREAKSGTKHPKFKGYYFANFQRFTSATQAGKYLKCSAKTVINRCRNEKFRLKGWYFLPV